MAEGPMSDVRGYTTLRPFPSPSPTAPSPALVPPLPSPPHLLPHLPPIPAPLPPSLFRDPLLRRCPLPFFASSAIPTARPPVAQGVSSSSSRHPLLASPASGSYVDGRCWLSPVHPKVVGCPLVVGLPGSPEQPGTRRWGWNRPLALPLTAVRSMNTVPSHHGRVYR
ncbi:hypothetical protein F5877DRAFT_84597 [Lentinula edodes]|nr:hypothetical protein F5877DRAFT_84597 [Lentinula edodes]